MTKREKKAVKDLVGALDEYVTCMGAELSETAVLADLHGWRSSRVKKGKLMRERIAEARAEVDGMTGKG